MLGKRESELSKSTHYRTDRVSAVNGQYFFSTREGTLEGPYFSRVDAEREINQYIYRQIKAKELLERSFPDRH